MAKAVAKDLFMQFASMKALFLSPSTGLVEVQLGTGLSIRGGLAWLIHQVEFSVPVMSELMGVGRTAIQMSLSTKKGVLANAPTLEESGVLAYAVIAGGFLTSGMAFGVGPPTERFAPPVPLAAPNVSFYFRTRAAVAGLIGQDAICRIGYTTTQLDAALWQEIAETWGW